MEKCIKRVVILLFVALSLSSVSGLVQARDKDSKHGYASVYESEHDVCDHFLQMFNSDIAKYGNIQTAVHDEFRTIKWASLNESARTNPVIPDVRYSLASLDINNDGKQEYVVKESGLLGGAWSDNFYIFNANVGGREDIKRSKADPNITLAKLEMTGRFYELKMIPPRTYASGPFKGKSFPVTVGGRFSIYPMLFRKNTYISINERLATNNDFNTIDFSDWHVIAKYLPDNQLLDVCYFKSSMDREKRR